VIEGCNFFWVQKLTDTRSFVGGRIIVQQQNSREQKNSFRVRRTTVLGMFKDSAIILDAIRPSFFTKSSATFTPVRVDFGRPPLSSSFTSSLPSRNPEYHLKTFIGSESHSRKPFYISTSVSVAGRPALRKL
jgi:hypothetical protein